VPNDPLHRKPMMKSLGFVDFLPEAVANERSPSKRATDH
jgi:hypothetical protein